MYTYVYIYIYMYLAYVCSVIAQGLPGLVCTMPCLAVPRPASPCLAVPRRASP